MHEHGVEYCEKLYGPEKAKLNREKIAFLGNLAIRSEQLGINDPLTHLFNYINNGDFALDTIRQDIESDIAERLPNVPFVNYVDFNIVDDDIISAKDKVSMREMTKNNLNIVSQQYLLNHDLYEELDRAKIEYSEVDKIIEWYKFAKLDSFLIFESLPIGEQTIAVSRIYQKQSNGDIKGSFVSLHNPDIDIFNRMRQLYAEMEPLNSPLSILESEYYIDKTGIKSLSDFIESYVDLYDQIKYEYSGNKSSFGLPNVESINGIDVVREYDNFTSLYEDVIKKIAQSQGFCNEELLLLSQNILPSYNISIGDRLSLSYVRELLKNSIRVIAALIDSCRNNKLNDLESFDSGEYLNIGSEVAKSGSYDVGICPEIGLSSQINSEVGGEADSISKAFGSHEIMTGFGEAKIGVCRIDGCPSKGHINWLPRKTIVGSCDICIECHKHFLEGKDPSDIYNGKDKL